MTFMFIFPLDSGHVGYDSDWAWQTLFAAPQVTSFDQGFHTARLPRGSQAPRASVLANEADCTTFYDLASEVT